MRKQLLIFSLIANISFILLILNLPTTVASLNYVRAITIELYEDGSAKWIIEKRFVAETEYERALFFNEHGFTKIDEYKKNITKLVNLAWQLTGRNMSALDIKLTQKEFREDDKYRLTVSLEFIWLNFSKVLDEDIYIGDVFDGNFVDLREYDSLTIIYPPCYTNSSVPAPNPDEFDESRRALVWYGPKDFERGKPRISFKKFENTEPTEIDYRNLLWQLMLTVGIIIVTAFGGFLILKKYQRHTKEIKFEYDKGIKLEDDERKIIDLLIDSGGTLSQSAITRKSEFSKSKTSKILTALEKKGIISRKKKGRTKIVSLIKVNSEEKNRFLY